MNKHFIIKLEDSLKYFRLILIVLFLIGGVPLAFPGDFTWNKGDNGDWRASNWDLVAGTDEGVIGYPDGTDTATIDTAWTVTLQAGTDISIDSLTIKVESTAKLILDDVLDVNGNIDVAAGTLDAGANQINIAGNWTIATGATFDSGTGTVVFDGTADQTVDPGASSFNNLTKQGETRLTLLNNTLTANGTLTINAAGDIVDMANLDFSVGTLVNNGALELDGDQATQSITTMDTDSGLVLYNGAAGGTVRLTSFYNLEINQAAQTFALNAATDINGNLNITDGILDTGGFTITISGNFDSSGGGTLTHGSGEVVFIDKTVDTYVRGNNTFYNFTCTESGKTIYFRTDHTQTIDAGGTFTITGAAADYITLDREISTGTHWILTIDPAAHVSMQYVNVYWSEASPAAIVIPPDVTVTDCINWLSYLLVISSFTEDNNPQNGKIDRILAQAETNINNDFSGFEVRVNGYGVTGYSAGPNPDEFYIYLAEGPILDTDAQPKWWIETNTTLLDSATGTEAVALSDPVGGEAAADGAQPVIGYTLAVADKNEIFVHFSEPVYKPAASPVDVADFSYSGAGTVTAMTAITVSATGGTSEALLALDTSIPADEIEAAQTITVATTVEDQANLTIPTNTHRVSDIGLGLVGNGVIEPLWARDETKRDNVRGGIGLIKKFDATEWLRDQDITLQAHIHNVIGSNPDTELHFDSNVDESLKLNKLWLPPFDTTKYNGLITYANTSAHSVVDTNLSTQLRNFTIPDTDLIIKDGNLIEFFLKITGIPVPLYCGRLPDPNAADWYRSVQPWSFNIRDVRLQRGGVSILNNVINPTRGETVKLHYVLPQSGMVTILVFDLKGDIVNVLYRGRRNAGDYTTSWNGKNRGCRNVARGVYFIKGVAPGINEIRKVLVVK